MPQSPILLSIGFLLLGLLLILIVWSLLRFVVPKFRPSLPEPAQPAFIQQQAHNDAVLIVEMGGRIQHVNASAREWFELFEGEIPHLERLARRVRPGESFLELCAAEGQARFSINGKLVDAVSYRIPGPTPATLIAIRRVESSMRLGRLSKAIQSQAQHSKLSLSLDKPLQAA